MLIFIARIRLISTSINILNKDMNVRGINMSYLSQLYARRSYVIRRMTDTRNMISNLEDKISRLQRASNQLSASLSDLRSIKSSIDRLNVDRARWKGKEQNKFENNYSDYKHSVKDFVLRTENAKDTIDQDLHRYEVEKSAYTIELNNLKNTLYSIESQISREEMR